MKRKPVVENILKAAQSVLAFKGYPEFTIRTIAKEAGVSVGNVQYYFKSKDILLEQLLLFVTELYNREYAKVFEKSFDSPQDRFIGMLDFYINDMPNLLRRGFFMQAWALAPIDDFAEKCMEEAFSRYRDAVSSVIRELVPSLTKAQCDVRASAIQSLIEGAQLSQVKKGKNFTLKPRIRELIREEALSIANHPVDR